MNLFDLLVIDWAGMYLVDPDPPAGWRLPDRNNPRSLQRFAALGTGLHVNKTPLQATSTAQRAGPAVVPDAGNDFESFYRREHDGQVRRAYLLTGSPATAHDVVADAFVAVYRRWDRLDQPGPYLNRCVLNGCRAVHRRLRRRLTPLPADDRAAQDPAFDHPATELGDVLAALPFGQRAAVVLRFYGGFSSAEIATMLGCRPGTVRSQLHRGLRQLRMFLNEEEI